MFNALYHQVCKSTKMSCCINDICGCCEQETLLAPHIENQLTMAAWKKCHELQFQSCYHLQMRKRILISKCQA